MLLSYIHSWQLFNCDNSSTLSCSFSFVTLQSHRPLRSQGEKRTDNGTIAIHQRYQNWLLSTLQAPLSHEDGDQQYFSTACLLLVLLFAVHSWLMCWFLLESVSYFGSRVWVRISAISVLSPKGVCWRNWIAHLTTEDDHLCTKCCHQEVPGSSPG